MRNGVRAALASAVVGCVLVACNALLGIEPAAVRPDAEVSTDVTIDRSASDVAVACPCGPFGPDELYFGGPVEEPLFDAVPDAGLDPKLHADTNGAGFLSADGLHFVQPRNSYSGTTTNGCSGCYVNVEYHRVSLDDDWDGPNARVTAFGVVFHSWLPHVFLDNLAMFGCHGGANHCVLYERSVETALWPATWDFAYCEQDGGPWQGSCSAGGQTIDIAFVPTPDGRTIAFASNRTSPVDDVNDGGTTDLWTAESLDPADARVDPAHNYGALTRQAIASSGDAEMPMWLSDDARTLIFVRREARERLWLTSRATRTDLFGAPVAIDCLNSATQHAGAFTLPSIGALKQHGGRGWGYLHRTNTLGVAKNYKVEVCVGSQSP